MKAKLGFILCLILFFSGTAQAARLKDIADIEGVRGNHLIGYGVVVGLEGTGDKRGATFTPQTMTNLLERLGIRVDPKTLQLANIAAVMVTAELPPFARPGTKIDVTLSSMGDAKSLQGGVLLMTPLKGADGNVYAVAQGAVSLGGFIVSAGGDTAQKNHSTVARVPLGGSIERSIPFDLFASGQVRIVLREPDFVTITRVQAVINSFFGANKATALDSASVLVPLDPALAVAPVHLIARLEQLEVQPDSPARVVVNERTGTVIIGEDVRVSTVALAHGNLNITIRSETQVSQPNPFGRGETAVVENNDIDVSEDGGMLRVVEKGVSLGDVVAGLNSLGATPRDLIAIFQALKQAGALQADLVIM
ncbi:MAG TPA: flagellar basal body P-ring protein FlgI [Oligoflexia bacterium]|nr:flagellar basal body P-ring protein FlgI [Oligoflexia bacterium]HMP49784.1 flagellar basal body P-ring protein FlgI [Oligoflexia bacterium]